MPAGIYLHIPFCRMRCSYCDFATDVYRNAETVERYVAALCTEIERFGDGRNITADTIYFGGGTPSILTPQQVERILAAVRTKFAIAADAEVTMEMNPGTVTDTVAGEFRRLGVDRASFGVQTFNNEHLRRLGRGHNAYDALRTYDMLRNAGFANISFDLIAGLPRQTMEDWEENLERAIAMRPEHLSLYLLEIHQGTPLAVQVESERQPLPDPELAAEMYEVMCRELCAAGYEQYEISNFSRPGSRSRHNSKYWLLEPVYGFGVSAHSFDGRERFANERNTDKYVELIGSGRSPEVYRETIDRRSEFVFLGLRLNEGISESEFAAQFGHEIRSAFGHEIDDLSEKGLIEAVDGRLRLTPLGRLFSNEVFSAFV